jgi:hypothetical protein
MSASGASNAALLRAYFDRAAAGPSIGGAAVLDKLSRLSSSCIIGGSAAQDAVAFALATIFKSHSEDRADRLVTGDDTYLLMASGADELDAAIQFIEHGGSPEGAIRLVAALARLTPDRLNGRWPPDIS